MEAECNRVAVWQLPAQPFFKRFELDTELTGEPVAEVIEVFPHEPGFVEPGLAVHRRRCLNAGFALFEAEGIAWAGAHAQPAAHALAPVNVAHAIVHGQRAKVTALQAGLAAHTGVIIHARDIVRVRQCVRLAKLDHPAQNPAAAGAAVADVMDVLLIVVHRMHQARLFGLAQDAQTLRKDSPRTHAADASTRAGQPHCHAYTTTA